MSEIRPPPAHVFRLAQRMTFTTQTFPAKTTNHCIAAVTQLLRFPTGQMLLKITSFAMVLRQKADRRENSDSPRSDLFHLFQQSISLGFIQMFDHVKSHARFKLARSKIARQVADVSAEQFPMRATFSGLPDRCLVQVDTNRVRNAEVPQCRTATTTNVQHGTASAQSFAQIVPPNPVCSVHKEASIATRPLIDIHSSKLD